MNRRLEILRRATEVFQRQGVAETSMEDIARSVGIKREAIYYYFNGRSEILLEIFLPQSRALLHSLRGIVEAEMSPTEKLRAAIRTHLLSFNPSYLEMTVAMREPRLDKNNEKLRELRETWKDYGALWVRIVAEGQRTGGFRPNVDARTIAFGLLGMCNWLSRWFDPAGEISIERIIDDYASLAIDGIGLPVHHA